MPDALRERLKRILPGGKGVWVPMDHGISGYPEDGLERMDAVVDAIIEGGADAIVCQKGVLSHQVGRTGWDGFVCHVSVSTAHAGPRAGQKVKVATGAECLARGAVGLSGQVNLGDDYEPEMIADMGDLTREAFESNLPTLGMIYPRGAHKVALPGDDTNGVAHAARVAYEIGCDVVKVPWTGSAATFAKVVEAVPIPVLIAGGAKGGDFRDTLNAVHAAVSVGGGGVCMGRRIFGAKDPAATVRAVRAIVHDGASVDEAMQFLE